MSLSNQRQLLTTIEYDYLVKGVQNSKVSDATSGYADVLNTQRGGYGIRLASMMRFDKWSVGPTLIYWHINQSDTVTKNSLNYTEPQNNTVEVGLKAGYLF
jgi:hypothetical protein